MKTLTQIVLFFILLMLATNIVGQQQLVNANFEQNLSGWSNQQGDGLATFVASSDASEGLKSMQVSVSKLGSQVYSIQSIGSGLTANEGTMYQISFWAKSTVIGAGMYVVNPRASYIKNYFSLSKSWKKYSYYYLADSSNPGLTIQYLSLATYNIDNIMIEAIILDGSNMPKATNFPLKEYANNCGINIGTVGDQSKDTSYLAILKREYNIVVNENTMKMNSIKSTETSSYNFNGPNNLLALAEVNGMKMRGHCLVWHMGLPQWVKDKQWTRESLLTYLKSYITTVVTNFKGKIEEWDVANEFVKDATGLRDGTESVWMKYIGEEVLDSAFKWTHAIDPQAKLFYNETGAEFIDGKSDQMYALVKRLLDRGVPIQGVGLQCHIKYDKLYSSSSMYAYQLDQNVKRLGALGLQVSFTEVDFSVPLPIDSLEIYMQALSYGNLLKIALDNSTIVKSFLTWGFSDAHSWIPGYYPGMGAALPFDSNYNPKPAYNSLNYLLSINCKKNSTPFLGNPFSIPGTIESEYFDSGGEDIAYHDADTINKGGAYRMSEGVDIQTTTDVGGGYNIGYVVNGEWVLYTVDVASTNNYNVCIRAASLSTGGELHIEIDNVNISGAITIPATGGWQTYTDVCALINLTKGQHTMKVVFDKGSININKYVFSEVLITDVNDNTVEREFWLYPNPAKDELIISNAINSSRSDYSIGTYRELIITNTLGQIVFQQPFNLNLLPRTSIDVSALKSGIYFLHLNNSIKKFIKQ